MSPLELVAATFGVVLLVMYVYLERWSRRSRAEWEAWHRSRCPGCPHLPPIVK